VVTIGTTTLGMLVFGPLAGRLGRKRLYAAILAALDAEATEKQDSEGVCTIPG
jgi:MFS family permease